MVETGNDVLNIGYGDGKLAAFQKKKSKKKHHHHDRSATSGDQPTADSSSFDQSSSSDLPLFEDSDTNLASGDEMNTQDSKSLFKTQAKLKQAIERIAELEESLEGKQLALDRVIHENTKLKEMSYQDKLQEMETALVKRDEIIRQLTTKLQTTVNLESDAAQLTQHVKQLQTQLINAGKLMESQNYKQSMSSQALVEAKTEIQALQQCIEDKDTLLNQLSDKVNAISTEYTDLKTSYEMSKLKESESAKVVNSLMSQVEEFRKQGNVNGSISVSSPNIDVKVQEVRLELEETYGKQIAMMKEELSQHYQTETESLENELKNLKDVCSRLENQQEIVEHEKQTLVSDNETYMSSLSDLKSNMADLNSKLSELQIEKEEILKQNLMLNEQTVLLKDQLEAVRLHQNEHVSLETAENVSSSVTNENVQDTVSSTITTGENEDINALNESNLKLSTELETLKREHFDSQKLIDDLQKKLKGGRSPKFQVDSQEIVMELKQVTEQYEEALVNIGLMTAKIEDYGIKCENLTDDLSKMNERYRIADETIKDYEVKIKEYEEKEVTLVSKLKEATEKGENAQKQVAEYCDKFVEYEQQLTDYEGLMTQFNELQHECSVYQNQNDDLNNKMNIQQDVVMELKAELEVLVNQNQVYQDQASLQTQELEGVTQENKSLQESINLYKDQVTKLTDGLMSVSAEMDDYRDKTNSLEIEIEQLRNELAVKAEVEMESKQKDIAIQELEAKVSELTSEKRPVSEILQKEVVLNEECRVGNEVVQQEEHCLAYDLNAIENQIMPTSNEQQQFDEKDSSNFDQSGDVLQPVQIVQSQISSSELTVNLIGQDALEDQSKENLKVVTDMDADSLDDDESTRTFDSIEDYSGRRSDLVTQISDLRNLNQTLETDIKRLSDENQDLKLNIESLNTQLHSSVESKSDVEQVVLTCRSELDKLEVEKSEMKNSIKLLTESNETLNEKVKTSESNLVMVMDEKMALQKELTFMNSIITEMSHDEGESQNENSTSEFDELSQVNVPDLCNKLQSLKDSFTSAQSTIHTLREECDQLKTKKCDLVEIHKNELVQKQEENDNLRNEYNDIKAELNQNEQLKQNEISMLRSENENLSQTLTETVEREQNLRVQVERLSHQISELSVINQTVNGDKENLENRFVEVSSKENTEEAVSVLTNTNLLSHIVSSSESHDLPLTNQNVHVHVAETDTDLNRDDEVGKDDKDQDNGTVVSADESGSSVMVTTPASSIEALQTLSGDQTTDQLSTVSTCMPTNLGQVMNVCSSVCVSSVNQLPTNSISGLVASNNDQIITGENVNCKQDEVLDQSNNHDNDQTINRALKQSNVNCKQDEVLDQNKLQDLSIASDESNFYSCSESFDQTFNQSFDRTKENHVQSVNHDNDQTINQQSLDQAKENGAQNEKTVMVQNDENSVLQDNVNSVEIGVAAETGDAAQFMDFGENENENNERSEHLRNVNTLLKVKLEDTQNDMSEMLNDRVELVGSMENFSDKINSLRDHNEHLSQDLLKLQEENRSLHQKLLDNKESSEIRCKLEDKIIEIVKENQKLKSDYDESQKNLLEEHESLKSAIRSWQECSEYSRELKDEVANMFKEMESFSQEKLKLETIVKSLEEAYVVSQSLNEELQRQALEDAQNLKEMERWRIHAEDIGSQYLESKQRFESEIERLKTNLNDVECQRNEIMENLQQEMEKSKISNEKCDEKIQEVEILQGQCLQINLEKDELIEKCKNLENELSELRTSQSELLVKKEQIEIHSSQNEKEFRSKIDQLSEKCVSQEELISEKSKIIEDAMRNQELWHEKEDSLTTELDELRAKLKIQENENREVKEKCITFENQNKDLQETCILYENKIAEMNDKCSNLENQLADIEESCLQCENENQILQEKCTGYEMQHTEMNEINEKSANQLTEIQHQLKEMKTQLSDTENHSSETENQLTEMNEQSSKMKTMLTEKENELIETKNRLTETINQLSDAKSNLTKSEIQLAETYNEISKIKNQLTETENQLTSVNSQLSKTKAQLTETKNQLTNTNNQLLEMKKELTETENQLTGTKNQLTESQENLNQNEKQNLELRERCTDFEGRNTTLQENLQKLESELEVKHKQCEMFENKEKEIDELEDTISSLTLQNKELHNNVKLKENDYEALAQKHLIMKNDYEALAQKHAILTRDKEDFENKLSLLTGDKERLVKQNEILENKLIEGEVEYSAAVEMNTQMKERLENKIENLSDENKELVKKCRQLELKKKAVNTKNSELVRTNNVTQEKLQQSVSELSSENESLSEKCDDFKKQVSDLSSKNESISEKYEKLKEHVSELTSQNEGLSEQSNCLQIQVSELISENKSLSEKSENLKTQVSELLSENESSSEKYKAMAQSLHNEQTKRNNLGDELEKCQKQCDLVNSKFEQLKLSQNDLDMMNKSLMSEMKESNNQCEEMQESLQKVMEELEQTQKSFLKLHEDHIELKNKKDDLETENDEMTQQKEKLSQDIEHLSEELASVDEERNELVKSQDLTEQSLRDMQTSYESLITLLQQTKGQYENEVSILKSQLNKVSEEVGNLRICQDMLQSDLNNVTSQKLQVISELEQKRVEHEQVYVQNRQLQQELKNKCEKDIHNQGLIDAKHAATNVVVQEHETATQTEYECESKPEMTNAEVQVDLAALQFDSDHGQVVGTVNVQPELENDNYRNRQNEHTASSVNESVEKSTEVNNDNNVVESTNSDNAFRENNDNTENDDDDEFISEEELEALIQQKIDSEKKQIEYDMEEKYELKFRERQVELMHTFDKKQKDLEKNFELQVNHRIESLRAEKDQAFVKALQKVKKDFEKRHKKEMEKQRLAHLHEMAVMQDERKGGGHISGVVQKLHQENQELAEARDALLQQVELSNQHQEQLEDELRTVLGGNVDGDGKFLCEPHQPNTNQPRHSYRSQSLMLDWEFSPTSSFEHDKDPPGSSSEHCLEDVCSRPQCVLLRREYLKLKNSIEKSGFHPEVNTDELSFQPEVNTVDFSMAGPGFKPEMENYDPDESDGVISTPTTELEASFVKEAMRKAAEAYTDAKKTPSCSTPKVDVFIENVASKDEVFLHKDVRKAMFNENKTKSRHVRSLSLNLPSNTDFFIAGGENDDKTLNELSVRHGSLDNFEDHKFTVESDEFLGEFVYEQDMMNRAKLRSSSCTPQPREDFLEEITHGQTSHSCLADNKSSSQPGDHLNLLDDPTCDLLEMPSSVQERNSGIPNRNSQGEFYKEEFISGEMEGFDPNDLNEMALIPATAPALQSQVIHVSESEHFAYELSEEEKNDNEKLLKRLESLKDIYCKEKQELLSKCENLTIQLENESLSRVQLEQELMHISEDFSENVSKSRPKNAKLTSHLSTDGVIASDGIVSSIGVVSPDEKVENSDKVYENSQPGSKLEEDNLICIEKLELLIKNLKKELQEKSEALQRNEVEICAAQMLQEQRLNEIKVLYKAELRKLEIENSSLLEQKYQLENQSLQLCKQIESNDTIENVFTCTVSVDTQTTDDEIDSKLTKNQDEQVPESPEQNVPFEGIGADVEKDEEKFDQEHVKTEREIDMLLEKCQKYEIDIVDKQHIINDLEEKCSSFQTLLDSMVPVKELPNVGNVQNENACMKELKEKCHHLEIELEYAKQNEAFACVYEDKCKQYEIELENKQDCEHELAEMMEKYKNLKQENIAMNLEHQTRMNARSLQTEDLQHKCNDLENEIERLQKQLNESDKKCEQYEKVLNLQQETGKVLKQLEDKITNDEIKFAEVQKKCANLSSRLELQRLKNEEKCKKYEAEIAHNEKALNDIHETCSKFENAGYENEHVIQELTSQCQKYQSEIQKLRAKELLNMKKKLSCSVDEIEKMDIYVEDVPESQSQLFTEEQEVVEGEITQTYVGPVEQNQNVTKESTELQGRIVELEAILEDKEEFIRKLESDLEQREDDQARMEDLRQYKEHIELSLREKDSYIKQLEEHFLQQRTPISVRSPVKPGKYGNVGKERQEQKSEPVVLSCSTPLPDDIDSIQSEYGSQTDNINNSFSDHSTISGDNEMSNSKSNESLLSDRTDNEMSNLKSNESLLSDRTDSMNNSTQTLADFGGDTSLTDNRADSHSSEKEGNLALEMKHFAIVEEISKLRQDLRETKSVYTQENALLKEALDREKWKRNSKLETNFMEAEEKFSSEVVTLQQKVSLLMETNDMLRNENDKWLTRVQEQETIVLQLQEQNGHVEMVDENNPNQSFNQQLKLLQQQRNELVEKLKNRESKLDTLSQTLDKKTLVEETLRREKAVLQAKLYELEEVEKELTEKKIELEKQKSTQRRLEEMIYHRDLIERELMKQKRLLEVELAEIECKLHEKEELLEIQKNQLLEEIKQNYSSDRISDTSKLLSSSLEGSDFSFDLSRMTPPPVSTRSYTHTTSPPSTSRSYRHTTPPRTSSQHISATTVPKSKSMSRYRQTGNVNRLELMLHDVEQEHAEAISYLKEKLQKDSESSEDQATGRQQSRNLSINRTYVNKTPHK